MDKTHHKERPLKRKKKSEGPTPKKHRRTVYPDIETLADLIKFYISISPDEYEELNDTIDLFKLYMIVPYVMELEKMIGMEDLKKQILNLILKHIQYIPCNDMMHTVIYGPPGTGKSTISMMLGNIFSLFGDLTPGKVRKLAAKDLVGKYLGQTEHNAAKTLEECKGGVFIIDEAYNSGSGDNG